MRKIVIKPKEKTIKGSFVVEVPSEKQRRRYASELVLDYEAGEKASPEKNLKAAERLDEIVNSHVKDIKIILEDGTEFKTYMDMLEDSELDDLCKQAQNIVLNGSLGEV